MATASQADADVASNLVDQPHLETRNRTLLLVAIVMVAMVQFFDATIANVALPHMRAALGASPESISWVLTSFIIATAIATPITGWLSDRVGSRNLFLGSTTVFLIASAACGAANSLGTMVAFRAVQGLAAAFIGPMTQTIMLDISPPSKQASTMNTFGMLVMVAPISGPFIGGFLTDTLNWRWIYYVNLPLGIPALAILWLLLPTRPVQRRPLDGFGFATLAVALAALQLLLDRGQHNDWFESTETIIELVVTLLMLWLFVVHTAFTKRPLFSPRLLKNPNFLVGCGFMSVLGITNIALSAMLPTMYQLIYGYPVMMTGLLMAPRGFAVIVTSVISNRLMRRMDYRYLIFVGFATIALSMRLMANWSPDMDWHPIVVAIFVQGLGLGMVFTPMQVIAFTGLPTDLRPDGAGLLGLFRSLGGSVGISVIVTMLAANQQLNHADLGGHVTALTDIATATGGLAAGEGGLAQLAGRVSRQAAMIAYLDNFRLIAWVMLCASVLPLVLRKPRGDEFSGNR